MRHGEPTETGLLLGRTNLPLSEVGRQTTQARLSGELPSWERVLASPLLRCAESADWLAREYSLTPVICEEIQEYAFGDWDGRAVAELYSSEQGALEAFWRDPEGCPPPNAESLSDFKQRIFAQVDQLLDSEHTHALMITHGGVILAIIADVLGVPDGDWFKLRIDYASFSRVVFSKLDAADAASENDIEQEEKGRWGQVVLLNSDHLPPA